MPAQLQTTRSLDTVRIHVWKNSSYSSRLVNTFYGYARDTSIRRPVARERVSETRKSLNFLWVCHHPVSGSEGGSEARRAETRISRDKKAEDIKRHCLCIPDFPKSEWDKVSVHEWKVMS
jgi:hypothetical protein